MILLAYIPIPTTIFMENFKSVCQLNSIYSIPYLLFIQVFPSREFQVSQ